MIWWKALSVFLATIAGPILVRVLKGIGFGIVTFGASSIALSSIKSVILTNLSSLPASVVQILYLMKLDVGISILFASMAAHLFIKQTIGKTSGFAWRKPNNLPSGGWNA